MLSCPYSYKAVTLSLCVKLFHPFPDSCILLTLSISHVFTECTLVQRSNRGSKVMEGTQARQTWIWKALPFFPIPLSYFKKKENRKLDYIPRSTHQGLFLSLKMLPHPETDYQSLPIKVLKSCVGGSCFFHFRALPVIKNSPLAHVINTTN